MAQFIYTYQVVCNINGKSYIGVHKTNNIDDGYLGNGIIYNRPSTIKKNNCYHNAIKKYGFDNFTKYIMCFFDTYEEALSEEKFIVNSEWVKKRDNYNTALGGNGNSKEGFTEEQKLKFKKKISREGNHRFGKKDHKAKIVLKYDLENNFIEKYQSITDAAKSINMKASAVSICCRGKIKQSKGFIFRFENYTDLELKELNNNLSKFKINYNQNGTFSYKTNGKKMKSTRGSGWKVSEETRKKMSEARIRYNNKMKQHDA